MSAENKAESEALVELLETMSRLEERVAAFEADQASQVKPIEAATLALKAAVEGLAALKNNELVALIESLAARIDALEAKR